MLLCSAACLLNFGAKRKLSLSKWCQKLPSEYAESIRVFFCDFFFGCILIGKRTTPNKYGIICIRLGKNQSMGTAGTTLIFLVRHPKICNPNPTRTVVRPCYRAITLTVREARVATFGGYFPHSGLAFQHCSFIINLAQH